MGVWLLCGVGGVIFGLTGVYWCWELVGFWNGENGVVVYLEMRVVKDLVEMVLPVVSEDGGAGMVFVVVDGADITGRED